MTPEEFQQRYGATPETLKVLAYFFAGLAMFLVGESARIEALHQPLEIEDEHMKHVRNETTKLQATFFNTIGAGFAVTGIIGPMSTFVYGTNAKTDQSPWQLGLEVLVLLGLAAIFHGLARFTLGRLEP